MLRFWLLLLVFAHAVDCRSPTVRIPVYRKEFVQLVVGSPGTYRTLRLDFAANDTLVLFQTPSSYSRSYVQYEGDERHGTELLYIGCHRIRVPTLYDPAKASYYDTQVTYHGVMGFGKSSSLWHHWQRYTLSSTTIVLGDYDHSLVRFNYAPFALQCRFDGYMNATVKHEIYRVYYRPGDQFTRLPQELYDHVDDLDMLLPHSTHIQLQKQDYTSKLPTGFDYSLLRKQPPESRDIVLGKHTVRQLVSHNNVLERNRDIRPAYDLFDTGNSEPHYNTTAGVILVVALVTWLLLVMSERLGDLLSLTILSHVELYGYVAVALLAWMNHSAFHCSRCLYHHVGCTEHSPLPAYGILALTTLVNVAAGVTVALWRYSNCSVLWIRRAMLESALVYCLWLTQIGNHRSFIDHFLLLVIAAFYTVLRSLSALDALLYENITVRSAVLSVYAVCAHLFVVFYTVLPYLDRFFYGFPHRIASAIMLWSIFVSLPTLHLFTHVNTTKLRNVL